MRYRGSKGLKNLQLLSLIVLLLNLFACGGGGNGGDSQQQVSSQPTWLEAQMLIRNSGQFDQVIGPLEIYYHLRNTVDCLIAKTYEGAAIGICANLPFHSVTDGVDALPQVSTSPEGLGFFYELESGFSEKDVAALISDASSREPIPVFSDWQLALPSYELGYPSQDIRLSVYNADEVQAVLSNREGYAIAEIELEKSEIDDFKRSSFNEPTEVFITNIAEHFQLAEGRYYLNHCVATNEYGAATLDACGSFDVLSSGFTVPDVNCNPVIENNALLTRTNGRINASNANILLRPNCELTELMDSAVDKPNTMLFYVEFGFGTKEQLEPVDGILSIDISGWAGSRMLVYAWGADSNQQAGGRELLLDLLISN